MFLHFIKYIDEENELPIKLSVEFIIFVLLSGGFNMYFDNAWLMTFFTLFCLSKPIQTIIQCNYT